MCWLISVSNLILEQETLRGKSSRHLEIVRICMKDVRAVTEAYQQMKRHSRADRQTMTDPG